MATYNVNLKDRNKKRIPVDSSPGSVGASSSPLPSAPASPVSAVAPGPDVSLSPGGVGSNDSNPPVSSPQSFEDIVEMYTKSPMSPEEEERRRKGASAAEAVGHLGNVLSSFSNLIFTGKGAPSQQLPSVPPPGLQKFEDRVAENRRRYVSQVLSARQMDTANSARAALLEWQKQKAEADRQERVNQRAHDLMKFNSNLSFKQAQEKARQEDEAARRKETERHNKAQESIAYMNAETARARLNKGAGSKQDYGKYHFTTKQGRKSRDFDLNKDADVLAMYREGVRGGIYPEIRKKGGSGKIDVTQLRNYILYQLGKQTPAEDISKMETLQQPKGLGWGNRNNNNKTDW